MKNEKNIKPIGKNILVNLAPLTNQSKSGIILQTVKREHWCEIVAVGPKVSEEFKPGMKIVPELGEFRIVGKTPDGTDKAIVQESKIIGIIEE